MVGKAEATKGRSSARQVPGPLAAGTARQRLSHAERRRQLLETALRIVREEGCDRLTLGQLAVRAGVSKPVAYDHFGTRSGLLIELYRWIDTERVDAFRQSMVIGVRDLDKTVDLLAVTYIDCAAETDGDFQKVGAALAGSQEKAAVFQELLEHCVEMFRSVLAPFSTLAGGELHQRCIGLVGAGEALAAALVRGQMRETEAKASFASLIRGALHDAP
jgi:AcrR family transcriptional regulator